MKKQEKLQKLSKNKVTHVASKERGAGDWINYMPPRSVLEAIKSTNEIDIEYNEKEELIKDLMKSASPTKQIVLLLLLLYKIYITR